MNQHTIRTPFFEIGPKSYLYGQDVVDLAIAADKASEKYGVDIIFTTPIISISAVKAATKISTSLPRTWTRWSRDAALPTFCRNLWSQQAQRASCSTMWKSR